MTHPFVTVIMPVRNEGDFILRSLGAVLLQDYPSEKTEILVADGMSNDGTREKIQTLQRQYPRLRLIDNPEKIVSTGLNRALRAAKGEIVVRVDGHCEIAKDYISVCVQKLKETKSSVVGGPIETVGETLMARAIAAAMSSWFGVGGSAFRTVKNKEMKADTVPFPAYRRDLFERVGFFDEELVRNQDDEHNARVRKAGGQVLLSPEIKSKYYSRSGLVSLWSQYFQYGFWKVRVMQKHPKQMKLRHFVPALFIFLCFTIAILSFYSSDSAKFLGGILGVYGTLNLAASILLAVKKGNVLFFFISPVIFGILHFGYGLGFAKGLFYFGFMKNHEK